MTEGSRHEKATITVLSYIIGFTAAYILFSNFTSNLNLPFLNTTGNTASVVAAPAVTPTASTPVVTEEVKEATAKVTYENGRLEFKNNDQVTLLSINPDISDNTIDTAELTQGFHVGELNYTINSDETFVFFCERHDALSETCSGYVYDINADRIYPVTKYAKAAVISQESADGAIFTAVGLKIGSNYSANKKAPWVMISGEDALDLE